MNEIILYNITICQGEDYQLDINIEDEEDGPVSMSGWLVEATMREYAESEKGIDFYTISNGSGIHLYLSHKQTADIGYNHGRYDVFVTTPDGADRVKLISGQAEIIQQSTR
jgi:hypothetical protein